MSQCASCREDAIEGLYPECWNCGTYVHDGPCVMDHIDLEGEDEAAA